MDEKIEKIAEQLFERIEDYVQKVVNGRIVACKKHKWACERYLKDKNNQDYYFDKEELLRFYIWSRQFKHRAGVLANQIIELTDFQLFVCGNLFCWKNKSTKLRKYRKAYIQLARKNAKSQLLGLIGGYETFLTQEQSETYLCGWDKEQSSIVYREILFQLSGCERLKGKFKDSYGKITSTRDGSFIKPLSREARNTGDGTNPSLGIIDEYHAHKTSEIYDVILSGMVARPQPLIVIITTAGFDLTRPCFKEYEYISKLLDPDVDIENEQYFALVCELEPDDDIKDESVWIKANPIVATYKEGIEFLRGELKAALDVPEKMRNFLTKNMNKWVDMRDGGYMDMSRWKQAGLEYSFEDFRGSTCNIGIDLAAKLDLTSVGFEFEKGDEYFTFSHSFMPEETYKKRITEGKLPFDKWVEGKHITITPGAVVDYEFVKKYIMDVEKEYGLNIKDIGYDPWNATQFANDMVSEGYSMVEIRQGIRTLGEPCKSFREEAYKGKLHHNSNPVLTWACSNAITREDPNGNFILDKSQSSEKIDPLAALINAHTLTLMNTDNSYDINQAFDDFMEMALKIKGDKN